MAQLPLRLNLKGWEGGRHRETGLEGEDSGAQAKLSALVFLCPPQVQSLIAVWGAGGGGISQAGRASELGLRAWNWEGRLGSQRLQGWRSGPELV